MRLLNFLIVDFKFYRFVKLKIYYLTDVVVTE